MFSKKIHNEGNNPVVRRLSEYIFYIHALVAKEENNIHISMSLHFLAGWLALSKVKCIVQSSADQA